MEKTNQIGRNIAMVSSLFLILGVCLPWGSLLATNAENLDEIIKVSILGIEGKDGIILGTLAILVIIFLLIKKIPVWISLIFGVVALIIASIDFKAMFDLIKEWEGVIGSGILIALVASLGIVVGTIMQIISDRNSKKEKVV